MAPLVAFRQPVPRHARANLAVQNLVIKGTLPPRVREIFGIDWSAAHEAAFRAITAAHRRARPAFPRRMRRGRNDYFFDVVTAREAARRHPHAGLSPSATCHPAPPSSVRCPMLELLAVAAAGAAAGASNSIAGAGSLITFPTMVALGLPPLSANVTNTVGIIPGSVGGASATPTCCASRASASPASAWSPTRRSRCAVQAAKHVQQRRGDPRGGEIDGPRLYRPARRDATSVHLNPVC